MNIRGPNRRNQPPQSWGIGVPQIACLLFFLSMGWIQFAYFEDTNNLQLYTMASSTMDGYDVVIPALDLGLPVGSSLILNIGSNKEPIFPRLEDGPCTRSIAFEPIVPYEIEKHPGLMVVPAAVSDRSGWATMNVYNTAGVSSSLGTALSEPWKQEGDEEDKAELRLVPTLSFYEVLKSLQKPPPDSNRSGGKYDIQFLKTDMQGYDFRSFSSVAVHLWEKEFPIPHIMTEASLAGIVSYANATNDLCWDWLPHMKRAGYVFEGITLEVDFKPAGYESAEALEQTCQKQGSREAAGGSHGTGNFEANVLWRHKSQPPSQDLVATYEYPSRGPVFEASQYKACRQ